ncbi:MAG: peptide-methionine (S)-S-oxide reductase MsrA [Clostridia bacterium]|nr:peptide-methionine (S)-S-oxide reductase MsrA [Clostridia bacterium]
MTYESAFFAGGCFWCITPTFKETDGVIDVISGYSGGDEKDPEYLDVKLQKTGHREAVRIDYSPQTVDFSELLDIFLNGVDPFDAGGQFIDRGHSYTLAVFYLNDKQKNIAENKIRELEKSSGKEVFISVEPYKNFYPAEEEHQDYYLKHPEEFEKELIESGRKKPNIV